MVRARDLTGVAIFVTMASLVGPAYGVELAMRAVAKEVQDTERLLAAAIATEDASELKVLGVKLSKLLGAMPDSSDVGARLSCGTSAQQLYNVVLDLRDLPPARRLLAYERDLKLYRDAMPACEKAVGLSSPSAPNLR